MSTLEVAETLSVFPGIKEANVYGVSIPGKDGRACMAACVLADDLSWPALGAHLQKNLPSYAVPIFVRKLKEIEVTGTFKHTKVRVVRALSERCGARATRTAIDVPRQCAPTRASGRTIWAGGPARRGVRPGQGARPDLLAQPGDAAVRALRAERVPRADGWQGEAVSCMFDQ